MVCDVDRIDVGRMMVETKSKPRSSVRLEFAGSGLCVWIKANLKSWAPRVYSGKRGQFCKATKRWVLFGARSW